MIYTFNSYNQNNKSEFFEISVSYGLDNRTFFLEFLFFIEFLENHYGLKEYIEKRSYLPPPLLLKDLSEIGIDFDEVIKNYMETLFNDKTFNSLVHFDDDEL